MSDERMYTFIMTHGFEPDGRVYEVQPTEPHKAVHPPERMVDAKSYDALTASNAALRAALEEAIECAEADLMAVGHGPDGEARSAAMAGLKSCIARWRTAIAASKGNGNG